MDSIAYSVKKANETALGKLSFEDLWALEDEVQQRLFEESILSLNLNPDQSLVVGKSFNRHHFSKGFLMEEFSILEDIPRAMKRFVQENFIMNYALFTPVENGWEIKIVNREECKTIFKSSHPRAA